MDFKQVGTLGTPIIVAAKNQLPELNGSYKGIFFKTTYDPSSEEDYPKGTKHIPVISNPKGGSDAAFFVKRVASYPVSAMERGRMGRGV